MTKKVSIHSWGIGGRLGILEGRLCGDSLGVELSPFVGMEMIES